MSKFDSFYLNTKTFKVKKYHMGVDLVRKYHPEYVVGLPEELAKKLKDRAFASKWLLTANIRNNIYYGEDGCGGEFGAGGGCETPTDGSRTNEWNLNPGTRGTLQYPRGDGGGGKPKMTPAEAMAHARAGKKAKDGNIQGSTGKIQGSSEGDDGGGEDGA